MMVWQLSTCDLPRPLHVAPPRTTSPTQLRTPKREEPDYLWSCSCAANPTPPPTWTPTRPRPPPSSTPSSPDARGFVYYHEQDTVRLVEDRATCIGYGAFLSAHLSGDEWEALSEEGQAASSPSCVDTASASSGTRICPPGSCSPTSTTSRRSSRASRRTGRRPGTAGPSSRRRGCRPARGRRRRHR